MPGSRLFLALVPDKDIVDLLSTAQSALKLTLKDYALRWENPVKFHMTLRFLGDVEDHKTESLVNILDRIKFDFDELNFDTFEIGFFPNSRYPNVVYAGFKEQRSDSESMVESIDSIIKSFGIKPDKKFVPHITLGRFDRSKRKKSEGLVVPPLPKALAVFESFSLMKSTLKQGGSEYTELYKFNFQK